MKTKERILLASIRLFNEGGISNIKLQNIADECNISVGNLAYHFKYKEDLMNAIAEQVNDEIILTVNSAKELPTLIDFDNQLSRYFALINKYAFFFLDIVELKRSYAKIHHKRIEQIELLIHQINSWIARNVDKQIFKLPIHDDQYENTAHAIWMIISFWLPQKKVLASDILNEEKFKILVWNQLLPNFTELGLMEYEALILPQLRDLRMAI